MTVAIIASSVDIHYSRKLLTAQTWIDAQPARLSLVSITWMEIMIGVPNKRAQGETLDFLNRFELLYLTQTNQDRAMTQIELLRFTRSVGLNDVMIAAVAYRLQVPLYTHNLKDMTPMIGALAIQPYA